MMYDDFSVRKARNQHACDGQGYGGSHACDNEIRPGDLYVEALDKITHPPIRIRYCVGCAQRKGYVSDRDIRLARAKRQSPSPA